MLRTLVSAGLALSLIAAPALAAPAQPAASPSAVGTGAAGKSAFARHAMVAAASPMAVEAGLRVLRAGGSAVDAAVAVQAVLGLVEPESSGVGGGAFMTYYDSRTRRLSVYDGREVAPKAAGPDWFLKPDGQPMSFIDAILSGRSTGVPGAIAMLELAHREHGARPWRSLFGDAERLADQGFVIGDKLGRAIASGFPQAHTPDANAYFTKPDGTRYKAGDRLRNPAYAATLRLIAAKGSAGLLRGKIADDILAKLRAANLGSPMTREDLADYRPLKREALCAPHGPYRVCAPPPPAGGIGVLETLGLLAETDIATRNAADPQAWVEFARASRLMYADRDWFVGDPAFVSVPTPGLLDPAYLKARAALIPGVGAAPVTHGDPPGGAARAPDRTPEPGGTSSFVIVDPHGDVVSMTTTVESLFGSGRMVDGFFLNNQLTDFSFSPANPDGTPAANAPAGGKRPRSSMAPTIVVDREGRFVAASGSPGGNSIIAYVAKSLVALLDWKMTPAAAVALPNVVARGGIVSVEKGASPEMISALRAAGLNVAPDQGEASGLHAIVKRPGGYEGGADPRRDGVAKGF